MGDFDRKKYENMMEEFVTDSEMRSIILDGFKGHQFSCPDTMYFFASDVVNKLCNCSVLKQMNFSDKYVLLFAQISNFYELVWLEYNKSFAEYIQMILSIISRSLACTFLYDKGYRIIDDNRGFNVYVKEA